VTNKAYLSRHVVFDETSFPAKDPAASLLPSQLSSQGNSALSLLSTSLLPTAILPADSPSTTTPTPSSVPLPQASSLVPDPLSNTASDSSPVSTQPLPTTPLSNTFLSVPNLSPPDFPSPASASEATPPSSFPADSSSIPLSSPTAAPTLPLPIPSMPSSQVAPLPSSHTMTTRSRTNSLKPTQFPDFKLYRTRYPFLSYHSL